MLDTDRFFAEMTARAARMQEELARSPHRCAAGCGIATLRVDQTCGDCVDRQRRERQLRHMIEGWRQGLPQRHRDCDFDDQAKLSARVRAATGIVRVMAACTATTDRITIAGPAGAGKTTLAAAAYMRLLTLRGRGRGVYAHARDLAMARQRHELGSEAPLVEEITDADVAIVDDMGVEGEVRNSAVADVVYARHAHCRPTIYTTSMSSSALTVLYGDGIARRVYETVAGSFVVGLSPSRVAK
jgi:DNA replication protein DnaC